jgi:hypothetical protein
MKAINVHTHDQKENSMNIRVVCEGYFTLPLPVESAVPLFTPEGERRWAGSSWDPVYAIRETASDGAAPGTVFTTETDGGEATWIVLERRNDGVSYARVAPGRNAGTINVRCSQKAQGETRVAVSYDVTSLGPEGLDFVQELEAGYDAFLREWRRENLAGLEREHRSGARTGREAVEKAGLGRSLRAAERRSTSARQRA